MNRVLCIEDDPMTSDYIASGLAEAGYVVDVAADGDSGLARASDGHYDAIVLDRMLPGLDGLSLVTALRSSGVATPVVMVSALASLDERVRGLRAGSDDYIAKPFALTELLARIEAVQRRSVGADHAQPTRLGFDDLEIDLITRRVTRAGDRIELQPREFSLLEFLLRHQGQVVTRSMLLECVWDYHFDPGTNVIDVHVSRLRKKLDAGSQKSLLRGAGYRLGAY